VCVWLCAGQSLFERRRLTAATTPLVCVQIERSRATTTARPTNDIHDLSYAQLASNVSCAADDWTLVRRARGPCRSEDASPFPFSLTTTLRSAGQPCCSQITTATMLPPQLVTYGQLHFPTTADWFIRNAAARVRPTARAPPLRSDPHPPADELDAL